MDFETFYIISKIIANFGNFSPILKSHKCETKLERGITFRSRIENVSGCLGDVSDLELKGL